MDDALYRQEVRLLVLSTKAAARAGRKAEELAALEVESDALRAREFDDLNHPAEPGPRAVGATPSCGRST